MLITTFGDGARFEINSRKPSTFEVAVNRVVSQTLALSPCLQPVLPVPIIAASVQDGVYDYRVTLQ